MPFTNGGAASSRMSFLTSVPLLEQSLSAYPNPVIDPSTEKPVEIGSIALAKQLISRAWTTGIHSHDIRIKIVAAMQLLKKNGIPLPGAAESGHDASTTQKDPCSLPSGPAGGPKTDGSQAPAGAQETDIGGQVNDKLPDACEPGGGVPPDGGPGGDQPAPGHQSAGSGHGEGPDGPDNKAGPADNHYNEQEQTYDTPSDGAGDEVVSGVPNLGLAIIGGIAAAAGLAWWTRRE